MTLWCRHDWVRCIHGDEILAAMTFLDAWATRPLRRARCLSCGRALRRGLPEVCSYTGARHFGGPERTSDFEGATP